jgi:hypothetical protein
MLPEAWDVEHNFKHHYELGEASDPDLLERNAHSIRVSKKLPLFAKVMQSKSSTTSPLDSQSP